MGTAVLVHGGWSNPADWRWVAACLRDRGVAVVAPDLPSHRVPGADRSDDAREVEAAVRRAAPPVVVVGWSYGGAVLSDLGDTGGIARLVYVGWYPKPLDQADDEPEDLTSDPHMLFPDEATVVLDDDWWLKTEEVSAFPAKVVEHLRHHRRRPITRSCFLAPETGQAWRTVPTTILLGQTDSIMSAEQEQWLHAHFSDFRIVGGDHFLPFLQPDLVAEVIAETFTTANP